LAKVGLLRLGFALAIASAGQAAPDGAAGTKGKTIRVKTNTCVFFELEETVSRDGSSSTFAIVAVIAEPSPGSYKGVLVDSWLVGAMVSGVKISTKDRRVSIDVSQLTVTPRAATTPLTPAALARILQAELGPAFRQGIKKGTLPAGTPVPVVAVDGLSGGTAVVIAAGPGTTPVMPDAMMMPVR
jgi:hypothetical protein